ncbi:hypothetical protein BH09PAT1_BH09PAT1_6290 [soil metagenome]
MKRGLTADSWLTAADFTPEGKDLTIEKVVLEEIEPNRSKLVVRFKNETKGLVLNELNTKIIAKNTGQDDTDNWAGYHITPYSTEILMRGEETPCIRVKILIGSVAFKDESM